MIELGGEALVLTHDVLVEGVHVLPASDPADIAWKLVAVNLSDLAAKGAQPMGVLIGHMLGTGDERFIRGLREVLDACAVPLLGGDTVSGTVRGTGPRSWSCTAIGRALHRPVPSRSGARAGDTIHVTGPLGAAMLGFEALRDGTGADSSSYRRPRPRTAAGCALAPVATAMMDISDGLLLDAWRMGEASHATLAIDSTAVPVAGPSRRDECLRWGDDYELLFTAPPEARLPVSSCPIGRVTQWSATPLHLDGAPLRGPAGLGYLHG